MKIALIGYGKMGKMIETTAQKAGHEIVSIVDPSVFGNCINEKSLQDAEVCIDFSNPSTVLDNIKTLVHSGKNVVMGTTGWDKHVAIVEKWVENQGTGFLYAPNFSIGVNLFLKIIEQASKIMQNSKEHDVAGYESHHNQKVDTPSGTAKSIANIVGRQYNKPAEAIPISSIRCGNDPGKHTVIFDSPFDTITLTHQSRNREGFAKGAVTAAEWLAGRKGFFTIEDVLFAGEMTCKT